MNKSRRSFLKVAGLSVFALSSGLATMAGSAQAGARIGSYEPNAKALKAKRWAMVIDTRAFKSAREYAPIIEACHKAHNVPTMEGHQDIKWMWLEKFDHAFPDDLNEHLTSRVKDASYPLLCNHCTNPPCVRVCPTQATYQMEDGIIAMDYHRCIGCRFCMAGCPFGARSFNFVDPRKYLSDPVPNPAYPTRMIGVVEKCTFCHHRWMKAKDKAIAEGDAAIKAMRALNDRIQDETISGQIDRLEEVSGKIFNHVKAHPEKLPQIRKFMSYYLPTTLKLLRSYDELSRQGVSGQNITGTMEKVEGMMATIVLAFEKQLDSLFGDQAMDISTDITVLDNMMAREGLTGGDAVHQAAQENPVADPQPELDIRNAGDAQTQPPQAEDSVDAGNGITLEL